MIGDPESGEFFMLLYGILGTGGLARECMPVCHAMLNERLPGDNFRLVFVSDDESCRGDLNGYPVMAQNEFLNSDAVERFYSVAINDSRIRESISNVIGKKAKPFSIISDSHYRGDVSEVGEGAILLPFSSITSNAKIGRFFHANHYARVAHDCVIGDYVTFAPSVQCNGGVVIEDHVYVGSGAIIRQSSPGRSIVIGRGAVVGMGAVVTKSVPPFTIVSGNPARIMRKTD